MSLKLRFLIGWLVSMLAATGLASTPQQDERLAVMELLEACQQDRQKILSGQNFGHANDQAEFGYQRFLGRLQETTGRTPSIASLDYGYNEIPTLLNAANRPLIQHWNRGGLVMVSMHPPNPWTGKHVNDLDRGNFDDLFREGTAVNTVWSAEIERVSRGLAELRDAGVVVLFRPFHEMNGGWFWWATKNRGQWLPRQRFVRLWRETHHFLTEEKGLTNLIWVYAPTVQLDGSQKSSMHYYPGDPFVDAVALDWYTDNPCWADVAKSYAALAQTKKPLGLAEFGPSDPQYGSFDNQRMVEFIEACPKSWAFFCYWHSWSTAKIAIGDHARAESLLLHPSVINRGEFQLKRN